MDKRINKMDKETLEQFMAFRKRGYYLKSKKGKGSYDRKKFKQGVA
jgi:stalled ribosome alternative rescue factor ArfA